MTNAKFIGYERTPPPPSGPPGSLVSGYYLTANNTFQLRLERGGGQRIFISCACFLITQPFLKIYRHTIHQIKAEYHSYLLVSIILYNSSEVNRKFIFLTFIFRTQLPKIINNLSQPLREECLKILN